MILALYNLAMTLAGPLVERTIANRLDEGKEDPHRVAERRGIPSRTRPEGRLVWLHAASVGESQAALSLIDRLLARDAALSVLVTSGTVTSAALLAERLPERAFHQFVPMDRPTWVARFLDHWRPDLALFVESEIWPNLLLGAAARGIPLALVNGRISERSFRRWRVARPLVGRLFDAFDLILPSNAEQAGRFAALTARPVECLGNLKRAAAALPVDDAALARLSDATAGRPVFLAASTHAGEEDAAIDAHLASRKTHPGLLTMIAPRHPARGAEVEDLAFRAGLATLRRSHGAEPGPDTEIYVADTLGEMGTLFKLADIVFVAGSLVPVGGHNPLEPAHFGKPVLFGPLMAKNADIAEDMLAAGAAMQVEDARGLAKAVEELLGVTTLRKRLGAAALRFVAEQTGIADRMADRLLALMAAKREREE